MKNAQISAGAQISAHLYNETIDKTKQHDLEVFSLLYTCQLLSYRNKRNTSDGICPTLDNCREQCPTQAG